MVFAMFIDLTIPVIVLLVVLGVVLLFVTRSNEKSKH